MSKPVYVLQYIVMSYYVLSKQRNFMRCKVDKKGMWAGTRGLSMNEKRLRYQIGKGLQE